MLLQLVVVFIVFCVSSGIYRQGFPSMSIIGSILVAATFLCVDFTGIWTSAHGPVSISQIFCVSAFAFLLGIPVRIALLSGEIVAIWIGNLIFAHSAPTSFQTEGSTLALTPSFHSRPIKSLRTVLWLCLVSSLLTNELWLLGLANNAKSFLQLSDLQLSSNGHSAVNHLGILIPTLASISLHAALLVVLPALATAIAVDIFIVALFRIVPSLVTHEISITLRSVLIMLSLSYTCYLLADQFDSFLNAILSATNWSTSNV